MRTIAGSKENRFILDMAQRNDRYLMMCSISEPEFGDRLARSLKRLEVTEGQLAGSGSPLAMQKEVALKEIEELNLSALQELRNLSSLHPKSGIIDKITQAGIRIT